MKRMQALNGNISFEKRIFMAGIPSNFISGAFIFLYSVWMMQLGAGYTWKIFWIIFGVVAVAQFAFAPFTNILVSRSLSRKIQQWRTSGLTKSERTALFKEVQAYPRRKQLETVLYFATGSVVLVVLYEVFFDMNFLMNLASFVACLFGTYIAGQLALLFSVKICSEMAREIVAQGIDDEVVQQKKVFGLTFVRLFVLCVIIPLVATTLLFFALFLIDYYRSGCQKISQNQFTQISVILVINTLAALTLVLSFFKMISGSSKTLQNAMQHIIENDIFTVNLIPTDISNEVSYNMYLVNRVVLMFRSILDKVRGIGEKILEPVQELTDIANETSATSFEQSAGVREILATMEENDDQLRGILSQITRVAEIAEATSKNVEAGFATLRTNLGKMNDITEANVATISGIRELGEKIEGIWEVVNIINDIAEQTRIIAFNAELEASGAGDAGKNFHIVANEIRRLAAGTTESVGQIRERITEIQHSSDNLIVTSESGTEKIREGCQLSSSLETKFADIQTSAEITVESVAAIQQIVEQQSEAFEQIVTTIRQISSGVENLSSSTSTVNAAATQLKTAADRLGNLHSEVGVHDENCGH